MEEEYVIAGNTNLAEHPNGEVRHFMFQTKSIALTGPPPWRARLEAVLEGETDRGVRILENKVGIIAHARYRGAPVQTTYLADGTPVHFAPLEDFTVVEPAEAPKIHMTPHAICRRYL